MVSVQGNLSGIYTIRNLSVIQRSIQKTLRRISAAAEAGGTIDNASLTGKLDPMLERGSDQISELMRAQVGALTLKIESLELTLNRNRAAESVLNDLREQAHAIKDVVSAAATETAPTPETGEAHQQRLNELMGKFNLGLQQAEYGGEKLFEGKNAVYPIGQAKELDVSTPQAARDSLEDVEVLLQDLRNARLKISARSAEEYDSTMRSLEAASHNIVAAKEDVFNSVTANQAAERVSQLIQQNAGQAAAAQGHLTSDSVFKLLHA